MRDYTKPYIGKFKDEHSKIYEGVLNAPHKEEVDEKGNKLSYSILAERHDNGLSPALAKLKVKDKKVYQEYMPALNVLTDAFIAYKKEAKIKVADSKTERFRESDELEDLVKDYMRDNKIQSTEDFVKHLNVEGPAKVMTKLLDIYKAKDTQKYAHSRIRSALPSGKGFDFYHAIAHVHGKNNNMKYSKRKLTGMSTHEDLSLGALNSFYRSLGDDLLPDEESIKDTTGKSK